MKIQFWMYTICAASLFQVGTGFAAPLPLKSTPAQPKQNALAVSPHSNDYSYKDLLGKNLTGKDLRGAWFYQSQLDHAVLNSVNASGVSFVGASLVKSHLRHAKLTGAYFNYADLTEADFTDADLRRADFLQAKLIHTRFQGANFARAELSAADLRQADLRGADLRFVQGPLHDVRSAHNVMSFSVNLQGAIYDRSTRWPWHMNPKAFGAVQVPSPSSAPIPMNYDTPLPYRALWGPYTVTVVSLGEDNGDCFRILDARGNVLREIKATQIQEVTYPHLSGRGPADLRVLTFPQSNIIGDRRMFVFTRIGGLHNVLIMPQGFTEVRDLSHNDRRELIADTVAPLEYVADVCHGCSPSLMLVLGWNGHRYVIQNHRYPRLARHKARYYRGQFLKARDHPDQFFRDHEIAAAIGYWANRETIGEGKPALHWLMKQMPRWARQWVLEALPDVRARLSRLPQQITVSQQRVIVVADSL